MNFIKNSSGNLLKSTSLLSTGSVFNQQQCGFGILKKPKKIKGVIDPKPHSKVELIDGVNQPEFLKYLKPTVPYHGLQNIQIKGYDYVVLNEFKRFLIRTLHQLDIKIKDSWDTPSQELSYEILQNESYGVEEEIRIRIFERNIQIDELPSYKESILLEMLMLSKPAGVKFTIENHNPEVMKKLYMIDMELEKAKEDLKDWSRPVNELMRLKKGSI